VRKERGKEEGRHEKRWNNKEEWASKRSTTDSLIRRGYN
jgi:hypothetical protein